MYQRYDPREHNRQHGRSEFRDYDEFPEQENLEDPRYYEALPQQQSFRESERYRQPQPQVQPGAQSGQRPFRYTGSATTNAARRYQDQWSPNWMTRGGAPEYRRNSMGNGEMYGLRQETSWDEDYGGRPFDHQNERPESQFRGAGRDLNGRGEFYGKGPKSYTRADQRMEEDINEQLTRHPYLDATDIEVKVKDGAVTLAGTVRTRECKRTAEDLAEDVSGVKDVQNQLRVVPSQLISSSNQQPQQHSNQRSKTH